MSTPRLPPEWFLTDDVVDLARQLLGKILVTQFDGQRTSVRISETEAYRAPDDRACHAYGNRRTARTETMFATGGCAYVYLCYGIHHLFNVVTAPADQAHAVLIRAGIAHQGHDTMHARRGIFSPRKMKNQFVGPGVLTQALGIRTQHNGLRFDDPSSPIWLEDDGFVPSHIRVTPRIGIDYAGECAAWPWRFVSE
jgi:DNA-3-methyladenine glycosylase